MLQAASIRELSSRLEAGSLRAESLVRSCLERIAEREPDVQAWAWLDADSALAAARAADAGPRAGPLHGIPFGVKDVIDTADMPTGYGSPIYAGHRPAADAAVIAALRDAGGIVLGKTVTCEFAGGFPSRTRNPLALDRTPGGSSSGSAAAVADFMVPVAFGTQTAGSILRPASFCGVVGYKPSFGMINRAGLKPFSETVDTIGLFARSVDDAAFAAGAIASRPQLLDDRALERAPRLLVCRTDSWPSADPDGQRALEDAALRLGRSGAAIVDGTPPFSCAELMQCGLTIIATDARRALGHELRQYRELLSDKMHAFLLGAETGSSHLYDAARSAVRRARLAFEVFLDGHDAVMTLSAPGEAPVGLESTGSAIFNFPWTLLHAPAISLPGLRGSHGLPIGIQLVGRRGADAALLRIARWAETALAGS